MKKMMLMVALIAVGAQAENVKFRAWNPGTPRLTTKTYSIIDSNHAEGVVVSFELTVTVENGFIAGNTGRLGVDAVGGYFGTVITNPETITFSLNVIVPLGYALSSLSLVAINAESMDERDYLYTDHLGTTTTYLNSQGKNVALDYDNEMAGIAALSEVNVASWSLKMENDTTGHAWGIDNIELDYTVIPELATLGMIVALDG